MVDDVASRHDFIDSLKTIGFFKDELNSVPMREFVGLHPKCYAFLSTGKVDENVLQLPRPLGKKSAKGVMCKVKDDHLHSAHYLDVLRSI